MTNDSSNNVIKLGVLVLLCLQNCSHALLTRYAKNTLREEWSEYEVVLMSEMLKMIVAASFMVFDTAESDAQGEGLQKVIWLISNGKRMIFVVIGYVCSNVLAYAALQRIDASVYTVLGQLVSLIHCAWLRLYYCPIVV